MKVLQSPERNNELINHPSIFLAGSIEMGKAVDWQSQIQEELKNFDVVIFNPRRNDWDKSWKQDISNKNFFSQVNWELDHLSKSDLIVVYFDPNSKAPITLLELGLFANSGKCLVVCPQGYWRRGNVQIVCERYNIPIFFNVDDLIRAIKERISLRDKGMS